MKSATATIGLLGVLLGVSLLAGCKSHKTEPAPVSGSPTPMSVAEINSAKLANAQVPQAVQTAFGRDYPKAAIDAISLKNTSAGLGFYQITFVDQGKAGVATYYATGAKGP